MGRRQAFRTNARLVSSRRPSYVPPRDAREKHLPGMNYCGPGTNVTWRMRHNVRPMDRLDALCLDHDIWTEPRGPNKSRGKRSALRAADRRLLVAARKLRGRYKPAWRLEIVINAMEMLQKYGGRGR